MIKCSLWFFWTLLSWEVQKNTIPVYGTSIISVRFMLTSQSLVPQNAMVDSFWDTSVGWESWVVFTNFLFSWLCKPNSFPTELCQYWHVQNDRTIVKKLYKCCFGDDPRVCWTVEVESWLEPHLCPWIHWCWQAGWFLQNSTVMQYESGMSGCYDD